MTKDWMTKGCNECRRGVLSSRTPPRQIATRIAAHARLLYCDPCGAWWLENERETHVIDEVEARVLFPSQFA